jgi:alkyldihydroxyacetonephosphate synthase
MQCGLDAQREMLQAGWTPAALRLYDAREVARLFGEFREDDDCLLLVVHEGPRQRVAVEQQLTAEIAGRAGCRVAPSQATQRWLESRNRVPTFRSFLEQGVVVDTIEVAAPYSRIAALYAAAIRNLEQVAGVVHASGHSSHAYRSGINLYLSFAAKAVAGKTLRSLYHECWTAVMEATLSAAGTISHHHGVGRVRREWIARDLGPGWLGALKSVKQALDPAGFMNPGVLLPD